MNKNFISSSWIIGSAVVSHDNINIGHVRDVLFDFKNCSVNFLIIAYGGIYGIGNNFYAIPIEMMELNGNGRQIQMYELNTISGELPKLQIDFLPEYYKKSDLKDLSDFVKSIDFNSNANGHLTDREVEQ